ncbi:MAG: hypothetical protein A3E78_03855 [Alphaproteobacteria bacterium RIFCSPHIGHO2_12_FULL_63_12]|nr:MAG: hypothetical protein A3E78_03855 [Alphaproteobacteria bacterium RIFCSPHIGHO2_12_FULL_63_12]
MATKNSDTGGSGAGGAGEAHGYLTSALVFAGITALWAVIVRNDPYYRLIDFFGARVPATMIAYLVLMPLAGVLIGRWRYDGRHSGGAAGYAGKLLARFVHFTYVHLLIVLFTIAMATDYFLGLNIDDQIKKVDDRMFDFAARFAPWLAAYLAGFNLGRAIRPAPAVGAAVEAVTASFNAENEGKKATKAKPAKGRPGIRTEPTLEPTAPDQDETHDLGDLALPQGQNPVLTASGLPAADADIVGDQPGFLPPQDFEKLRPGLRELR